MSVLDIIFTTGFQKSVRSASNEACVECAGWRKSARSNSRGNCVEVGTCTCSGVAVRDSKQDDGPILTFNRSEWRAFSAAVNRGQHDLG